MNDLDFLQKAEALLSAVEQQCDLINDQTSADIDNQRVGSMITLTFINKSQIIINLQKPLHEVWLASRSGGYHYKYDGSTWRDTKGPLTFWEQLTHDATAQSLQSLMFKAPD
jgi:CyaY protein